MKRIYASVALLLAVTTGAFAQQRHCDIEVLPLIGPADSSTYACNATVVSGYYFVNRGPDPILSTDTIVFTDPNLDNTNVPAGYIAINYAYPTGTQLNGLNSAQTELAPTMDIPVGDTIIYYQWNDTITRLWTLINADTPLAIDQNGDTVFNYVYTADDGLSIPPDGHYYWMAQTLNFIDTTVATDTVLSNNSQLNYITINCHALAVNDVNYNKVALTVFPNPAYDKLSFTYSFLKPAETRARITDLTGRTIKAVNFGKSAPGSQKFDIDLSGIPAGTYLIEVTGDGTKGVSKFTKN